jgi:hypothetical protein
MAEFVEIGAGGEVSTDDDGVEQVGMALVYAAVQHGHDYAVTLVPEIPRSGSTDLRHALVNHGPRHGVEPDLGDGLVGNGGLRSRSCRGIPGRA